VFRIDLQVPFSEKDDARRLGAHWDDLRRRWYVPKDKDPSPLARWLPVSAPNIRAPSYFIAEASRTCWRCSGPSQVHGFALPPGHETLYVDDETGVETWESSDEPTFVCYLDYVLPTAIARIRQITTNFRFGYRRRTRSFYWVNFCSFCGTKLGDYDTFCEPGQGFMPLTREEAAHIALVRVPESFESAAGGWSLGADLFDAMTQRD
jgi:hypothetical protein